MSRKSTALILIVLVALVLLWYRFAQQWFRYEIIGYLTGTQGLEAQFHSLRVNTIWLSDSEKPDSFKIKDRALSSSDASNWFFGYELNFDPDQPEDGFPNLLATQQPFLVDTQVEPKHYAWLVEKGTETLSNGTIMKKVYQFEMWRYRCEWSVNIWLSGPEEEAWDRAWHYGIGWEPDYGGTEIWIKLMPKRFVYFKDNPDEVYFAPAYIGLTSYTIMSIDKDGRKVENDLDMLSCIDLIPKAAGETLGIYYDRGGGETITNETLLNYQGIELDPQIFRNEYWIHMDLLTFKPWNSVDFWTKVHSWKYPSVNLKFTAYVFVVGKWTVYFKIGDVPQLQPHEPPVFQPKTWWEQLMDWLSNPFAALSLWAIVAIVVIIIVIVVMGPAFLGAALGARRRSS